MGWAHNFLFDSVVCSLADLLINQQGYFIIDDINITINDTIIHNLSKSNTLSKDIQLNKCKSVKLMNVIALYLGTSSYFTEIEQEDHNIKFIKKYR